MGERQKSLGQAAKVATITCFLSIQSAYFCVTVTPALVKRFVLWFSVWFTLEWSWGHCALWNPIRVWAQEQKQSLYFTPVRRMYAKSWDQSVFSKQSILNLNTHYSYQHKLILINLRSVHVQIWKIKVSTDTWREASDPDPRVTVLHLPPDQVSRDHAPLLQVPLEVVPNVRRRRNVPVRVAETYWKHFEQQKMIHKLIQNYYHDSSSRDNPWQTELWNNVM